MHAAKFMPKMESSSSGIGPGILQGADDKIKGKAGSEGGNDSTLNPLNVKELNLFYPLKLKPQPVACEQCSKKNWVRG